MLYIPMAIKTTLTGKRVKITPLLISDNLLKMLKNLQNFPLSILETETKNIFSKHFKLTPIISYVF